MHKNVKEVVTILQSAQKDGVKQGKFSMVRPATNAYCAIGVLGKYKGLTNDNMTGGGYTSIDVLQLIFLDTKFNILMEMAEWFMDKNDKEGETFSQIAEDFPSYYESIES